MITNQGLVRWLIIGHVFGSASYLFLALSANGGWSTLTFGAIWFVFSVTLLALYLTWRNEP